MMNDVLFFLVILLSNVIQGITGFAGTILAMPPCMMLAGYSVAKPVLNVLGLMSGIYVFVGKHKSVCWKELKKIVIIMAFGIIGGILIRSAFTGKEQILYRLLGIFVIFLSLQGVYNLRQESRGVPKREEDSDSPVLYLLLAAAGVVHGIFVSGGPLLIGYLTKKVQDKVSFRATISTIWIFLNTMILVDDIRAGLWNVSLIRIQLIAIPFLFAGMYIGSRLYVKMSQKLFMMITYVLLFISGVSLLIK